MLETVPSPFPRLDTAPWWRPISAAEFGSILGQVPEARDMDLAPGWVLSASAVFLTDARRIHILGWVNGSFAVNHAAGEDDDTVGQLWHLPTGRLIGTFRHIEWAVFAAEASMDLIDWAALTTPQVGDLPQRFRTHLEGIGFFYCAYPVAGGRMVPVWFRDVGGLN